MANSRPDSSHFVRFDSDLSWVGVAGCASPAGRRLYLVLGVVGGGVTVPPGKGRRPLLRAAKEKERKLQKHHVNSNLFHSAKDVSSLSKGNALYYR